MWHYFTINTIAEIICFFLAVVCLRNNESLIWRGMTLFMLITCITEIMGIHFKRLYLADRVHVHPNIWLYNILLIFQCVLISLVFQDIIKKYANIRMLIIAGLLLLATTYTYEMIGHGIFVFNNMTNTVMSVLVVIYSYYYYYCLLKDDSSFDLAISSEFWWVAGALFFYFGRTACNVFFDILSLLKPNIVITYPIYKTLNIILYSYWSYSFICRKWLTSTSKVLYQ